MILQYSRPRSDRGLQDTRDMHGDTAAGSWMIRAAVSPVGMGMDREQI